MRAMVRQSALSNFRLRRVRATLDTKVDRQYDKADDVAGTHFKHGSQARSRFLFISDWERFLCGGDIPVHQSSDG
jgi:hypothetical protein